MRFTLTISLDGAAFCDDETGEPDPAPELSRILNHVANAVLLDRATGETGRTLARDSSGNTVGDFIITDE